MYFKGENCETTWTTILNYVARTVEVPYKFREERLLKRHERTFQKAMEFQVGLGKMVGFE